MTYLKKPPKKKKKPRKALKRLGARGKAKLEAMKQAKVIYFTQFSKCQYCESAFEEGDVIDCHHKLKRSLGGQDNMDNLVIVHRHCHSIIHMFHYVRVRDCEANALNGEQIWNF